MPATSARMESSLLSFNILTIIEKRTFGMLSILYEYPDTLVGSDDIRLLHLMPGSSDEPLAGHIERKSLAAARGTYQALSYEWGGTDKTHSVTISGGLELPITASLRNALRDIRCESSETRIIWVDSICINQRNTVELELQVSKMGDIFRSAGQVTTYMGPEQDESPEAIRFARQLRTYGFQNEDSPDPRLHNPDDLESLQLPPASYIGWKALQSLIMRTWASRCWCALEFILNDNLVLRCGRDELGWTLILDIVQLTFNRALPSFLLPAKDPSSITECLTRLLSLRHAVISDRYQLPLLRLLRSTHVFRVSDPRDKVYSVLALAADAGQLGIPINYNIPVEDLYLNVATSIINASDSIGILYSCLHRKSLDLPSWVPDWSTWCFGAHGTTSRRGYSACGHETSAKAVIEGARLTISGCLIDQIGETRQPIRQQYEAWDRGVAQRSTWLSEEIRFVDTLAQHHDMTPHQRHNVLWRTLMGNITMQGRVAKAEDEMLWIAHMHYSPGESSPAVSELTRKFCDAVRRRSRYRRLAGTKQGYLAAVPLKTEPGDWLCMLYGGQHLAVLRQDLHGDYTYIGHAYCHGFMQGEALEMPGYTEQRFTLV